MSFYEKLNITYNVIMPEKKKQNTKSDEVSIGPLWKRPNYINLHQKNVVKQNPEGGKLYDIVARSFGK